jgi:hypothetical protein
MIPLLAAVLIAPKEMKLPAGAMCPDAAVVGSKLEVVYGDGSDAWLTAYGTDGRIRVNSVPGHVHAMGERGPKIAAAGKGLYFAWQGDYRQGPCAWFTRSIDGGKSFEPERNLIDGKTAGLDHVGLAASGDDVIVFWLDARGGQDSEAPVTSTIWYSLSTDGGKTFSTNRQIQADRKLRACACCSMSATMNGTNVRLVYRSGIANVRDIFVAEGDAAANQWSIRPVSKSGWVFEGCPMDGPRQSASTVVYSLDGSCYANSVKLGEGKYPGIAGNIATWQRGSELFWQSLAPRESGKIAVGPNRACVAMLPDGTTLIIH